MGDRVEILFELINIYYNTIIKYQLFQKYKLLRNCEFNYLTEILIFILIISMKNQNFSLNIINKGVWCLLYFNVVKMLHIFLTLLTKKKNNKYDQTSKYILSQKNKRRRSKYVKSLKYIKIFGIHFSKI